MINHATTELFFDDLEVPADALVGQEGKGFRYDPRRHERGAHPDRRRVRRRRPLVRRDGDRATRASAIVFGRPIGANQGVQFPIARAHAAVEAADLMRYAGGRPVRPRRAVRRRGEHGQVLASDASWEAANVAMDTHGGFGFAEEYDIERKFRETRLYQMAPISNNLVLAHLAHNALKLPRSY